MSAARLVWDGLQALASLADDLSRPGRPDLRRPAVRQLAEYQVRIAVGDGGDGADQELAKLSSVIEEKDYRGA